MINFWKLAYETVKKQRDKLKEENEKLEQIREIKDNALKGADIKIKALERENRELKDKIERLK